MALVKLFSRPYIVGLKNVLVIIIIAILVGSGAIATAQSQETYLGTVPAPEFPTGLEWLNVRDSLSLHDLRGKIVILDFWTYGCINCVHVIPELNALEEKYREELVVIGVHSGKFDQERQTDSIKSVLERLQVRHPVVNDKDFEIWRRYGIRAWPTLVLIDPNGLVIGIHEGERIFELFDQVLGEAIEEFDELGILDRFEAPVTQPKVVKTPLRFPGKVLADHDRNRIFISDTRHNRIVVTTLQGKVIDVIGSGVEGFLDGAYGNAQLASPQGLALVDADTLLVADTGNHAIRKIELIAEVVTTVIGTGEQGYLTPQRVSRGFNALNSPWDLEYLNGQVYIAMAGQHQLWVFDLETGDLSLYAGSGKEELVDGPLLQAGLNQPSGLATDGNRIYFADTEASAIRSVGVTSSRSVTTIVGTGLFEFGDVDGIGKEVRLQHPLGVESVGHNLYVADTYNNKIKLIGPTLQDSRTVFGSGESGWSDGDGEAAKFNEPSGLSYSAGKLYVADTNNHVIRVIDLATQKVDTLVLKDTSGKLYQSEANSKTTNQMFLPKAIVKDGASKMEFLLKLPEGYVFTNSAPSSITLSGDAMGSALRTVVLDKPEFPLVVPVLISSMTDELKVSVVVYFCQNEKVKICLLHDVQIHVPIEVSAKGSESIILEYEVPKPEGF